jgi:putative phage-type endonuclease
MMEQRTEDWFLARKGKVTASRIADVMAKGRGGAESLTRAKYLDQLVTERLTKVVAEGFTNDAIQRGVELEATARDAYCFQSSCHVDEVGFVGHPSIDNSGASPDGLVGTDGLVEIKCPNSLTHIEYILAGKPPAKYIPQMAWQLACTGRKWVDFVSYDDRLEDESKHLFIVRYERDDEYIAEMEEAVKKFLDEVEAKVQKFKSI